jgi:hypothetical protein
MHTSPAASFQAAPPNTVITGRKLSMMIRSLDAAGRMHLAQRIAAGELAIAALTPTQICEICRVPPSHRARVLEAHSHE